MAALTSNDAHVLSALFDPELSLTSRSDPFQSQTPNATQQNTTSRSAGHDGEDLATLRTREASIIKPLSSPSPTTASITTAISSLTDLITVHPTYASAHVNRAQANRMLLANWPEPTSSSPDPASTRTTIQSILADLSTAISLNTPSSSCPAPRDSHRQILASAHTHRAHLYHTIAKHRDRIFTSSLPEQLARITADELDERASEDFRLGGLYGNEVARQMAVRTNPYAKMCGAIVREALEEEMGGGGVEVGSTAAV
jgi:hypothetical protein